MAFIDAIHAREILDSRGNPTVEVEVLLTDGSLDAQPFPQVPQPESSKQSNVATATRTATWAKA